ncbi:hypothetical protein ACFWGM_15765 [Streptomyces roseolus]|uniref:hypothetical protein n=1 Tax=Streptomyces roseolus TaxID=67358 RepID=UPI003645639C
MAVRRASIARPTSSGTPSSGAPANSSSGAASPPVTTRSATIYLAGLHIAAIFIWSARWPDRNALPEAARPDCAASPEAADSPRTLVVGTWPPIRDTLFGPAVYTRVGEADTTATAVSRIETTDVEAVFVHLDEVDGAGHSHGTAHRACLDALDKADNRTRVSRIPVVPVSAGWGCPALGGAGWAR